MAQAPPFDEHRRPLAPSKFLDVCVTEKNSIIVVASTPLVVNGAHKLLLMAQRLKHSQSESAFFLFFPK